MKKLLMEDPHPHPVVVAQLHYPKTNLPLESLSAKKAKSTKKKAKEEDEETEESELFDPTHKYQPPANAKLTYRGGALLANTKVFTIYWGEKWGADKTLKPLAAKLNTFFKDILVSPLINQLAEYSVPAYKIGHGSFIGTKNIAANAPVTSIADSQIKTALQGWIAAGTIPKNDANTLYFIYFEPGIKVTMGGSASCTSFCGYHSNIGSGLFYSAMPYPNCSGCLGGLNVFDSLTGTSSHELCEAITDPIPGTGWYDTHNGEIGDICAWTFKKVNGYTVQKEWSNKGKKCV